MCWLSSDRGPKLAERLVKGWIRIWEPRLATHTTDVGCDPAALAPGWHLRACDHEQRASTRILVAQAIWPLAAHGCTVGQPPRTVANISDRAHAPDATLVRIPRRRFCPDTEEVTGSNPVSPTSNTPGQTGFASVSTPQGRIQDLLGNRGHQRRRRRMRILATQQIKTQQINRAAAADEIGHIGGGAGAARHAAAANVILKEQSHRCCTVVIVLPAVRSSPCSARAEGRANTWRRADAREESRSAPSQWPGSHPT